jgi:RHS repeat-associated protein
MKPKHRNDSSRHYEGCCRASDRRRHGPGRTAGRVARPTAAVAVAVFAMSMAGCSRKEPAPSAGAFPAALNSNPQITNFAVYAQNSATLRDRTVLMGGDVGVHVAGTGPFLVTGYELALAASVQVDTTHNTIANRVLLQGAKVGDVQTNTLTVQNGGTYAKKYVFPTTMPALPALAPVFAGTAALTVNGGATVVVSPGAYGAVSIGTKGTLRLQGGVYHLASLQLDDDARIEALASVQIRVAGRVTGRLSTLARVWIGAATGVTLTAADLRIEVSGKNGTSGTLTDTPIAAMFGTDATILGEILVPNGTLQIGQRDIVTGVLVGRDVYVDMDSKVTFQSGMAVLKCAQFCNDGNPCTKDTCTGEVCSYPSVASGTSCSDGNPCNGAEKCDGTGKCKAGTPISCTALDQCHAAGVCDPGSGVCSNPTKADGTSCNDGNACTVSDICKAGTCSGTTYSCDDGLACTTDACKGDGTCTHTLAANNCVIGGACYASGAVNPTNSCQQCTPATSTSNWTSKSNGTACSDGNACTKGDVCTGGGCAGTAYSCDDKIACTTDVCNGDGTCSHPVAAGSCLISGACYAAGAANPTNPCQQCTPTTSQTAWSAKTNGTACNDGNACTKNDVCTAGACAGTAYSCDDGLACTTDSCNGDGTCSHTTAAGNCLIGGACYSAGAPSPLSQCQQCTPATSQTAWSAKANGTACNDGNACTSNDKCTAGTCGGTLYSCDDGLACTNDVCNGDGTCTHSTAAGNCLIGGACYAGAAANPANTCQVCNPAQATTWSTQANGTACNDGNACTQTDTCLAGTCTGSNPVQCTASDQCHDPGTCAPSTGVCSSPAKPDGTACDDGKAESQGDACTVGVCQGTLPCASVADVHVGTEHTCAVRTDGSLWCWGDNSLGELGTGTTGGASLVPVRAGAATWNWTSVTTGGHHTCGIRRDGTLWCWGDNAQGQLGNGTTEVTPTPTQVAGLVWTTVEAGQAHTCGVQKSGSLWCWGHNEYGALGNGTRSDSPVPVEVVGMDWVVVAAGAWHTCGIKSDQTLWCWGHNANGQLGNGSPDDSLTPVQIGGADWSNVSVGVATGGFHTCGVKLDGSLWCWGGNGYGQLGIGSTTGSLTPAQVGSAAWTNMSGGAAYTCGVRGDGTLWSWGYNDHGQLGDGTLANRLAPVRVPGQAWAQVAAGNWHTCGRRQDGSLWCWGNNTDGEIGDGATVLQMTPEQAVGPLCSQVPICGNGQKEQGEECDDGNNVSGDGCTWDCQVEKCFGVECTATDECHGVGVCDPGTGTCSNPAKDDGTSCTNAPCMQGAACQAGVCNPGGPVQCTDHNQCYADGTCDPTSGTCSYPSMDKIGCNISLQVDGVVDMGGGSYIAIFGYDSTATTSFHPTTNVVSQQVGTTPQPPAYLLPGTHIGSFLPVFDGSAISWTVDSQTVTAYAPDASHPALEPQPIGTGTKVDLPDGTTVMLTPDLSSYLTTPTSPVAAPEPSGASLVPFNGVLAGQLGVGPTGAATYTVPITIPPGIGGMAPNLNLVYNSQSGQGIAGQGWDLTGLSSIYRCRKTMPQDGYSQSVGMTATPVTDASGAADGICLDGKRLFPRSVSNLGTVFDVEFKDFTSIVLSPDGQTFTVTTKSGEIRSYGSMAQSRLSFPLQDSSGNSSTTGQTVVALWALDKVMDAWGNYYTITYNGDSYDVGTYGLVATEIDYTGNSAASSADGDSTSPFNTITLTYTQRSQPRSARFGNSTLVVNALLTTVVVGGLGTYALDYSTGLFKTTPNSMDPDKLQAIAFAPPGDQHCLSETAITTEDPNCVKPLKFHWSSFNPLEDTWWSPSAGYALPTGFGGPGIQFVDLDGDGRVDLVHAKADTGTTNGVWRNNGHGWDAMGAWALPSNIYLADADGVTKSTFFMDIDGDGLPDLLIDTNGPADIPGGFPNWVVYLNRLDTNKYPGQGGWVLPSGSLSNLSEGPGLDPISSENIGDIDGDGRPDLIYVKPTACGRNVPCDAPGYPYGVEVASSDGTRWNLTWAVIYLPDENRGMTVADMNRDGLADLVSASCNLDGYCVVPDGKKVYFNTGFKNGLRTFQPGSLSGIDNKYLVATGDIDGDGLYDQVFVQTSKLDTGWLAPIQGGTSVYLMTGTGAVVAPSQYADALNTYTSGIAVAWNPLLQNTQIGRLELADLNADGLADVVVNHAWGGAPLLNRNSSLMDVGGSYCDPNESLTPCAEYDGGSPWIVPSLPMNTIFPTLGSGGQSSNPLDAFTDVDGDGVVDRVQSFLTCNPVYSSACTSPQYTTATWLNRYRPPVILSFPNGVAQQTQVYYADIATENGGGVYTDDAVALEPNTAYSMMPMRVVKSVVADNGTRAEGGEGVGTTTYQYSSLRASSNGHGSLGFKRVIATDPSNVVTTTTYSQTYPYIGRPVSVVRSKSSLGTLQETDTVYNASPAPSTAPVTPVFVYPSTVTDTNYLYSSPSTDSSSGQVVYAPAGTITTTTEYEYDTAFGNVKSTTVTTTSGDGESYMRKVANEYGAEGSHEQRFGKITLTTVTAQKLSPQDSNGNPVSTHKTEFGYSESPGSPVPWLSMKKIEPGGGVGTELDTAYAYDQFGNLTAMTSCATDFDSCASGALGPAGTADSSHLPFRSTTVSYDPNDFDPSPAGVTGLVSSLNYGIGRFPVKTTDALGHVQYSAYDPRFGSLVQSTEANGIQTCYTYDSLLGLKTSEIGRCGSASPLSTTFERYLLTGAVANSVYDSQSRANAVLVTVTRPPNGAASWMYSDGLGRTVETLGRSFQGGFVETRTDYDSLGRIIRASKPFLTTDQPYWATTAYDDLNRAWTVAEDLGLINGGTTPTSNVLTMTYQGSTIQTSQTVNGQTRTRSETKSLLGKVVSEQDASGSVMSYLYDGDGNLTDTYDPSPSRNNVHIAYDLVGRKQAIRDPDLGAWSYTYDGFGDLISQANANGQTTMTYDLLGRMTSKTDQAGTAQWVYDVAPVAGVGKLAAMISAPDSRLSGPCGVPATVPSTVATDGNRAIRSFSYTPLGDLAEADECVEGETFAMRYTYDSLGRQSVATYPEVNGTSFRLQYNYTSLGFLHYVSDVADQHPYWVALARNAAGQVTDEQTRNGVETQSTRNPSTGWLLGSTSTSHAQNDTVIQSWTNTFDEVGNLRSRARSAPAYMADSVETFGYDFLDRLTSSEVKIASVGYNVTDNFAYDNIGNLTQKGGQTYSYAGCGGRPHAVCHVGNTSYTYDGNGNMTNASSPEVGTGKAVTYNSANKVTNITSSPPSTSNATTDNAVAFIYGADGNRVVQSVGTAQGGSARTVYVGLGATGKSVYERTTRGTTVEHVHFLYAGGAHGGNAFALRVATTASTTQDSSRDQPAAPPVATKYYHFDHLGSVTATSDDMGNVAGPASGDADTTMFGYDAWGARRNPDGSPASTALNLQVGHREFTSHETIPGVGLVNMNGRVYDPALGRFLSPDPNVQFMSDLQSYNRYSYALNNPLRYTDPTGYAWYSFLSSPTFWIGFYEAVVGAAVCAGSMGAACVPYAMMIMAIDTTAAIGMGAPWQQVLKGDAIGLAAAVIGGYAGGAFASGGYPAWAQVVGGAVGGSMAGAMSTAFLGGNLGQNALAGALMGAATAAVTVAIQEQNPLSIASAAESQGGGGAGAEKLEALLKTRSAGAGSAWNWANGDVNALFNEDYTGFSQEFIDGMQPVFDKLQLNVDLSQVSFGFGGGTNYSVGYDITLEGGMLNRSFDDVLGATLHELGHVVQFQNASVASVLTRQAGEVRQMAEVSQGRIIPPEEALPANLDKGPLYDQDPYLGAMSLKQLAGTHLLGDWTLESQADRFRDLLLANPGQ